MLMNKGLFSTQLYKKIQANTPDDEPKAPDIEDVKNIDIHRCTFSDFKKAMSYMRSINAEYCFNDFTIDAVKPSPIDFSEEQNYDFVVLTEYAKHSAITMGNMALLSDIQKLYNAAENFNYTVAVLQPHKANILSFQDYNNYEVKEQPNIIEELGSCVIGGGNEEALKLTATFHASSTAIHPIISISGFSLTSRSYLTNRDIVDLDTIYKPNASMMEVFAYLSYMDHLNNQFNKTFDKLLISNKIELDSLDDMYSTHFDLTIFD